MLVRHRRPLQRSGLQSGSAWRSGDLLRGSWMARLRLMLVYRDQVRDKRKPGRLRLHDVRERRSLLVLGQRVLHDRERQRGVVPLLQQRRLLGDRCDRRRQLSADGDSVRAGRDEGRRLPLSDVRRLRRSYFAWARALVSRREAREVGRGPRRDDERRERMTPNVFFAEASRRVLAESGYTESVRMRPSYVGLFLLFVSADAVGCGDRTGLMTDLLPPDAAAEAAPTLGVCGAPDPPEPLLVHAATLGSQIQSFGNVAGSGCSFAVTWEANLNVGEAIIVRTAMVISGKWTLSPLVTVWAPPPEMCDQLNAAAVGWDGSAYTVAWTYDGELYLRRLSPDGTILGPPVRSVATGPDSYICWIDPSPEDGTLRLGLLDDRDKRFSYRVYFLKVAPDGTAVVPAVALTPETGSTAPNPSLGGFSRLPTGENRLLWQGGGPGIITFSEILFNDLGDVTQSTPNVLEPLSLSDDSYLPGGVTQVGTDTYFGVLHYRGNRMIVGIMGPTDGEFTYASEAAGHDAPALAAVNGGTVGVLSGKFSTSTDLFLSFVVGDTTTSTAVLNRGDTMPGAYSLAAGSTAFGALWETPRSSLKLVIRTP
jgi:hypothetical protein